MTTGTSSEKDVYFLRFPFYSYGKCYELVQGNSKSFEVENEGTGPEYSPRQKHPSVQQEEQRFCFKIQICGLFTV